MSGSNVIRLDGCALTNDEGVPLSELALPYIAGGYRPGEALSAVVADQLIDLSRRVYAARQGV